MSNLYHGNPRAGGLPFAIAASRFNDGVTSRLVAGAEQALLENGVPPEDIDVVWVPGALELPLAALTLADSGRYAAIIALGCVIKHQTLHFELVAQGATQGLVQASLETGVPMLHGILACFDEQQAYERAGGSEGNKGYEVALSALEMADLLQRSPWETEENEQS
ncbi:MAG TPA: 6,7-dimethyl-8-ribityllumazine synthase [Dehalococcoidia bacterium]|nr:6,7-dimethyl-8-ribityllumazine synthase [Dehalococcoidia bacterium]